MSIDLHPALLTHVQAILKEHVPDCEVWVFGSRAGGVVKRFSDLDLALVSDDEIPVRRLALLANAFEESDLPFRVDVVDCRSAGSSMKERIAQRGEIIFDGRRPKQERKPCAFNRERLDYYLLHLQLSGRYPGFLEQAE